MQKCLVQLFSFFLFFCLIPRNSYSSHSTVPTEISENQPAESKLAEVIKIIQDSKAKEKDIKSLIDKLTESEINTLKEMLKKGEDFPATEALKVAKKELKIEEPESSPFFLNNGRYKSPLDQPIQIMPKIDVTSFQMGGLNAPLELPKTETSPSSVPLTITDSNLNRILNPQIPQKTEKEIIEELRRRASDFTDEYTRPKHIGANGRMVSDGELLQAEVDERKKREEESTKVFTNMVVGGAKRVSQGFNPNAKQEYDYLSSKINSFVKENFKMGHDLRTLGMNPKQAGSYDIPGTLIGIAPNMLNMLGNPDGAIESIGDEVEKEKNMLKTPMGKLRLGGVGMYLYLTGNETPEWLALPNALGRKLTGYGDLENSILGLDTDGRQLTDEEKTDGVSNGTVGVGLTVLPLKGAGASKGTVAGRLQAAQETLGKVLSREQSKAVIKAHHIGKGEIGRDGSIARINNYTTDQLQQKYNTLAEAGFKKAEIKTLMDQGIVGIKAEPLPPEVVNPRIEELKNFQWPEGLGTPVKEGEPLYRVVGRKQIQDLAQHDHLLPRTVTTNRNWKLEKGFKQLDDLVGHTAEMDDRIPGKASLSGDRQYLNFAGKTSKATQPGIEYVGQYMKEDPSTVLVGTKAKGKGREIENPRPNLRDEDPWNYGMKLAAHPEPEILVPVVSRSDLQILVIGEKYQPPPNLKVPLKAEWIDLRLTGEAREAAIQKLIKENNTEAIAFLKEIGVIKPEKVQPATPPKVQLPKKPRDEVGSDFFEN